MRKMFFTNSTISLLIAMSIIGCEADKPAPKSKTLYVQADGGLRMRQTPNLDAERIMTIPDGAAVKVLKTDPMRLEISGKSGKWTLVSYGLTSGWVFGGFLSSTKGSQESVDQSVAAGTYEYSEGGKVVKRNKSGGSWKLVLNPDGTYALDWEACEEAGVYSGPEYTWSVLGDTLILGTSEEPINLKTYENGSRICATNIGGWLSCVAVTTDCTTDGYVRQ